jgi:hypothetical protein
MVPPLLFSSSFLLLLPSSLLFAVLELTEQLRQTQDQHDEELRIHNNTYKTATKSLLFFPSLHHILPLSSLFSLSSLRQIEELNQLLSESRNELRQRCPLPSLTLRLSVSLPVVRR